MAETKSLLVVGRSSSLNEILEQSSSFNFKPEAIISLGADSVEIPKDDVPIFVWDNTDKVVDFSGIKIAFAYSSYPSLNDPVDILISQTLDSADVRKVGEKLTPWYHFVPGSYFEAEPFYSNGRGTRLVSLSSVGSSEKWAHLVQIGPAISPARPLTGVNFYNFEASHRSDLIWGQPELKRGSPNVSGQLHEKPPKKQKRACYMCLDSPAATQELVVATGSHVYLSTARGPIQSETVMSKLNCAGHVLLIPRAHIPSIARNGRSEDQLELRKFEIALGSMYRQHGLEPVTYEFVRDRTVHGHTQVVPIPASAVDQALQQMQSAIVNRGMSISRQPPAGDYLAVRVSDKPAVYAQLPSRDVDLQLPRAVLCKVLGLDDQAADWKQCILENEARDGQATKRLFQEYNFLDI